MTGTIETSSEATTTTSPNKTNSPKKTDASSKTITSPIYNISQFKLKKILNNNTVRKSIALLGIFPDISDADQAIIVLEKPAFTENDVQTNAYKSPPNVLEQESENETRMEQISEHSSSSYFTKSLRVQTEFVNNIYGSFLCIPHVDLNGVKTTVIYPATDKHISKYSITGKYLVNETPACYENITLPYLKSSQFSLDWVYNILEHKQETERIVFEDSDPDLGFVLLPDLKWDGRNPDSLYVLAIVQKRDIKSIRDLSAEHLPLLRNIRERAAEAITQKYGICNTQLRMYFHYQPSFYHLHVHINPIRTDAAGIWCEKSHMLDTVINNLELVPDYYSKASLPFVLYEGSKLLDKYEEENLVKKKIKLSDTMSN